MTEGTEVPQDVKEVPPETKEVSEARQELDRATLEPAAAVEKTVDIKTSEAVEAAVKEAVAVAVPAADRGTETEDLKTGAEGDMDPDPVDSGAVMTENNEKTIQENVQVPDELRVQLDQTLDKTSTGESFSEIASDAANEDAGSGTGDQDASEPSIRPEQERIDIAVSTSGEDFSVEMTGAQPGEVRGFVPEEDGSKSYELKTDGQAETQTVQEQVENLEAAQGTPPESAEGVTLRPVEETTSPVVEEVSAESGEAQRENELEEAPAPNLRVDSAEEMTSPDSAAVLGQAPSGGSGLPVDSIGESSQDEPAAQSVEGDQSPPLDVHDYAQEILRETYLDSQEDLADHAEKVSDLNAQKEAVRSYAEDLRSAAPLETSPATLAEGLSSLVSEGEGGQEKTSSGKSFDEVQTGELNRLSDAAMSAGSLATPYIPGGSVLVSALDGMTQLKEAAGNGGSGEGESSPAQDDNDDSDSPVDATPQTSSISGIGETGDTRENTEVYQLQIAALEKSIETLKAEINDLQDQLKEEMKKIDQLQEMLKEVHAEQPVEPSRKDFPSGEDGDAAYEAAFTDYRDQMAAFNQQVSQLQSQIADAEETITAIQDAIEKRYEDIRQANDKINDLMGLLGSESNQNISSDPVDSPSGSIGISTVSGSATPPPSGTGLTDD